MGAAQFCPLPPFLFSSPLRSRSLTIGPRRLGVQSRSCQTPKGIIVRINAMRGSIDQLGSWAKSELKYWERAALAKIADYTELTDDDINELVRYFVEDAGLAPIASSRPPLPLLDGEAAESGRPPCRLNRISDLRNVNALPNRTGDSIWSPAPL